MNNNTIDKLLTDVYYSREDKNIANKLNIVIDKLNEYNTIIEKQNNQISRLQSSNNTLRNKVYELETDLEYLQRKV